MRPFADGIRDARWTILGESSHLPHIEERARCMGVVRDFLDEN